MMKLNAIISFALGNLCDLIIDSGIQENIMSKDVVERLLLETKTYPNPHAIGWIKEVGGIRVNERCKVSFSIGKYMDAKRSGRSNLYDQLDNGGIKYTLVPFSRKN